MSPRKHKDRGCWVLWKHKGRGRWVLWNMSIGTSTQGLNLIRKKVVDSLRGPLILNSKDRTLDLGNWYTKRNLCTYSLIWTWVLECISMQPSSWNAVNIGFVSSNAKGFESWKLCNAHDILSSFCDFFLFFYVKNTDWLSLFERYDNSCNLILSFANLFGDSLKVYVWFNHLTIFGWRQWNSLTFNQSTEILILGFVPFFFLFKMFYYSTQQGNIRLWVVTLWYVTKWNFPELRS